MGDDSPSRRERSPSEDATLRSGARARVSPPGARDGQTAPGSVQGGLPATGAGADRFHEIGEIARGGMGSVRRVYDSVLRREVAMKVGDPGSPAYAQTALRFIEEAQVTGQLDHPNIVPVHDLGTEHAGIFFTMKLVEGETLTELMERLHAEEYDHIAIENVLQIFLKICDAIAFAHSRGVVHRDLKPDNVMVGSFGQVYVMDWGVALLVERRQAAPPGKAAGPRVSLSDDLSLDFREENGSIVGTFEYMSPEQAWGRIEDIDERTDVFGLGALLYHLLTGQGPNAAPSAFEVLQRAQRGRPDTPERRGIWRHLPPGLCEITMRALAKRREDRYQSALELKADVEDFLRGGGWFQTETFEPGTVIVEQGDPAESAYIITHGTCEVSQTAGGVRKVLRSLGVGDVFGETAVLTGEPRSATVRAVDRVTVKVVTRDALEQELGRQSWGGAFAKALARRFRDVDEQLSKLRGKDG